MNTVKNPKRALLASALALLMCVSMLIGSTYAWFTDSVVSTGNIIKSGTLDVEMFWADGSENPENAAWKDASVGAIFSEDEIWEPGYTAVRHIKIENKGNLALKYQLNIFANGVVSELAEVIDVYYVDPAVQVTSRAQLTEENKLGNLADLLTIINTTASGTLKENDSDTITIALKMREDAGPEYQDLSIGSSFTIQLLATQLSFEGDSIDNQYDANANAATSTVIIEAGKPATMLFDTAAARGNYFTELTIPANAFPAGTKITVTVTPENTLYNAAHDGGVVGLVHIDLKANGATPAALTNGEYVVSTYISKGLNITGVNYEGDAHDFTYDPLTGSLSFTTTHFSTYEMVGKAYAYDLVNDVAFADVAEMIEAIKEEDNTVIIPEENLEAIKEEIVELNVSSEDVAIVEEAFNVAVVDGVKYETFAEAFEAAINSSSTVKLLKNVVLKKSFAIKTGKTVVLDLNGNTITGIDETSKSFGLFNNNGKFTVKDSATGGKITLAATIDSGWSRYSSVISNNPGGKFVLDGGIIEHLGGTDMAYAIDNLTNGKNTYAETVINGGTVKSTYRAIRMFLNGVTAQNILTVNGGVIEGLNKSIWMQDPSASANTGALNVSANASLYGDVYLTLTAGSTSWPVEVSINEAALKSGSKVATGNVPAQYKLALVDGCYTIKTLTLVENAADLKAAVAAGGEIILGNDITVDANTAITVASGKNVSIDLNGHKISATASKSGNQELFLVKGTMTVVNGSVELVAENNQGWSAMAAIFDVTAGGVLNMQDVTAYVGGTDMNFIVHLNNWGSATLNVNDCDFTASYVAIRAFNSGYDMNNVTVKNTDFHGGRVFWVHNYTAEGASDATLNLDIYGNNNTTDNAVPVRYGFSESIFFDINGNVIE